MKLRFISIAILLAIASAFLVAPMHGVEAKPATGLPVPVTGTFTDALGGTGTFAGTFYVNKFTAQGSQLAAVGTLTGTLTNSVGTVLGSVTQSLTLPVANISATCQILHLELGPLDLDLLGLRVHLNRIVLDISAQQGPGNLLGNLLCAIAGLLDNNMPLNIIAAQLNVLLDVLKQLGLGLV